MNGRHLFLRFFFIEADAALPFFDGLKEAIALGLGGPDGFSLFEPDLVLPFPLAIVVTAEMWSRRDPHDAVERNVLIVNSAKDGHGSAGSIL
jgi:hypothetical protein